MRKTYHITKKPDGSWAGKAQGGQRASAVGTTKAEIIQRTVEIAKNRGNSQIIIHKMNGKFQSERTYGNDPNPPKG